jgi:hypothetical protein
LFTPSILFYRRCISTNCSLNNFDIQKVHHNIELPIWRESCYSIHLEYFFCIRPHLSLSRYTWTIPFWNQVVCSIETVPLKYDSSSSQLCSRVCEVQYICWLLCPDTNNPIILVSSLLVLKTPFCYLSFLFLHSLYFAIIKVVLTLSLVVFLLKAKKIFLGFHLYAYNTKYCKSKVKLNSN